MTAEQLSAIKDIMFELATGMIIYSEAEQQLEAIYINK